MESLDRYVGLTVIVGLENDFKYIGEVDKITTEVIFVAGTVLAIEPNGSPFVVTNPWPVLASFKTIAELQRHSIYGEVYYSHKWI